MLTRMTMFRQIRAWNAKYGGKDFKQKYERKIRMFTLTNSCPQILSSGCFFSSSSLLFGALEFTPFFFFFFVGVLVRTHLLPWNLA